MNQIRTLFVAAILVTSVATSARAQGPGRPTAGIFGGVSSVSGDFKNEVGNGWLAGGLIKMRAWGPLDVRVDGTYVKLGSKEIVASDVTVTTDARIAFGTINALLNLGPDSAAYPGDNSVSPYLLGGIGSYQLEYDWTCTGECAQYIFPGKQNHVGISGGFGATMPLLGIRTFAEARYHRVFRHLNDGGSRSMILIAAGVKFR